MAGFETEQLARVLQFVTGTSGVPSQGFAVLQVGVGWDVSVLRVPVLVVLAAAVAAVSGVVAGVYLPLLLWRPLWRLLVVFRLLDVIVRHHASAPEGRRCW